MRASDLDLRELLDFDPSGGVIHFGGQRAVIFDALALGLLRGQLVRSFGLTTARSVLTKLGFAHGWRTAETMKTAFPWDSVEEWRRAGGRLHTLQGLVVFEPVEKTGDGAGRPFAEAVWRDSYEAEQHLLHLGRADEPVCWTLCGYASGYLSAATGKTIYCVEERCRGKGDAVCTMVGKTREEWGEAIESQVQFFESDCLETALRTLTDKLKQAERKLHQRRQRAHAGDGPNAIDADYGDGIIARSEPLRRALDLARRVAPVDTTVLVTGESGVGKEVVARLVHTSSTRVGGPFVAVNCGAVPEALLESELFGHARGSFTGATSDRPGLFEEAAGGTLFLDEIGELTPATQVKLLRALQEHEVRRVGENKSRKVDVRVVAATNRDLAAEVTAGRFRQDLYYRLRVVEIRIPPLRERREDILPLARTFLDEAARRMRRKVVGFTPAAVHQLARHDWPGNVRELENAVERAVVMASSALIDVEDLPEEIGAALPAAFAPGDVRTLEDVERDYILAVLRAVGGNKARAASQLGIGTATLFRKLKKYGGDGDGKAAAPTR